MLQSVVRKVIVNVWRRVVKLVQHLHAYLRAKDKRVNGVLKPNVVGVLDHYLPVIKGRCDYLRNDALVGVLGNLLY